MIAKCAQDGAAYSEAEISEYGFRLDPKRDIRESVIRDPLTGEETEETEVVFNFVGFVTNEKDDMLVVFPKHYRVEDAVQDSQKIFDCISEYEQKRKTLFMCRIVP